MFLQDSWPIHEVLKTTNALYKGTFVSVSMGISFTYKPSNYVLIVPIKDNEPCKGPHSTVTTPR